MDPKKQYIIDCIHTLLKVGPEQTKGLAKAQILDNFLTSNDQNKQTLNIIYLPGQGFKVYKFGESYPQDSQIINLTKITGEFINEDNISRVISFNLMPVDVMKVLQQQLQNFYIPALKNTKGGQITKQMEELKNNIDNQLEGGGLLDDEDGSGNDSNVKYIYKPADEFDYWIKIYSQATNDSISSRAKYFSDQFNAIDKQFRDIRQVDINGMKELSDQTIDAADKIWTEWNGQEYPEVRMKKFIEICGNTFIQRVQLEFKGDEIWDINKSSVRLKLNECVRFLKYWQDNLNLQIEGSWNQLRPWNGPPIDYDNIQNMVGRINEILELRNQYEELNKIASISKNFTTNFKETFEVFKGINALNSNLSDKWNQAKSKYSLQMSEIEEEIVQFLKKELFNGTNTKDNPVQVIREMQGWHGLMTRQGVMKKLQNERSSVLVSLLTITEKIRNEFDSRSGAAYTEQDDEYTADGIPSGHNFSKVLNAIIWTRQLIGKVKKVMTISQSLLNDLKEFGAFKEFSEQLLASMKEFESEQFDFWKSEIQNILDQPNNELCLQMSGRLMELDLNNGLLKVNYSERLVLLIRETRQLFELGYRKQISREITEVVENGKKFYKEALTLKQVANFYNSMSSQIIETQKKMLIEQASEFEEVVKNVKDDQKGGNSNQMGKITWDNSQQLENYIQRVQEAANNIMSENRRLRKLHLRLIDLTSQLFDVDIVKDRQVWLERLEVIKRNIEMGCANKDPKLCRFWRVHWDFQLYKALEHQYQRGLQTLDNSLSEMSCDIVLKGTYIGFRPPLEELKDKYYKEIKNFISWPAKNFPGVGGNSEVFKAMAERNSQYLGVVYVKGEKLFEKLLKVLDQFKVWLAIGFLDFDQLKGKMKKIEDWEYNIKNIRHKRKELEKLPDHQKVECFNVYIAPFKQSASDLLQNLIESMTYSLKDSLENEVQEIEAFVNIANERLMKKPTSKEEMHEAKENYFQIKSQKREKQRLMDSVETKNKLLRNLQGMGLNITGTQKKWENFELSIADFDKILAEQTEQIKQDIGKRTDKTTQEIEKFYLRWQSTRPEQNQVLDKETTKEIALKMEEWKQQWDEIEGEANKIKQDCEHFDMDPPEFGQLERVSKEVNEYQGGWNKYNEFAKELAEFEKQHWVVIRTKLFEFQDFYMKWNEIMLKQEKDELVSYMLKQIDNYKQLFPLLKLMHGGDGVFKDDHWRDLFGIIKIDKRQKIEDLEFGQFLEVEENILANNLKIKDLQARAQGEIVLRLSIVELTNWIETYEFEFTEYQSNNRTTPLIKEWKDMLTKVSDNQSLLSSIKESKYYHRFQDQIENFERKIGGIDEYLSKLQIIQRKWVYLEPIFGRGALPQEQHRFRRLDEDYRNIMQHLDGEKKVASLCQIEGVGETLGLILDQLERCQKALNEFLEEKRGKFPRFYFLGDDDLLEILGQSQNPEVIQMHLKKLFAGIHKVDFNKEYTEIVSMISSANEVVVLKEKVEIEEYVENWLSILSRNMQKTLQDLLNQCLREKSMEPNKYPSQILCISEEIRFTEKCVSSLKNNNLPSYKQDLNKMLEQLTSLVGGASHLVQLKLKALILDLIHHIEVLDTLIKNQVTDLNDWYWYKQLKYEMNSSGLGEMIMCKARFDYTYEYQGNAPKLVHTPLTDKCYLTLTQGMSMGYGGNPYGPAGTGKTESVKALGNAFGRQVLVFNCDEGLDFKSMGRIFIGLVKCGAWGCFDEFNRLLEEQLSAISQQIQIIQWAIKERETSMNLLGNQVDVNKNSGIFVTLNPAGKGYGGRSKLPDNLKQLFRPVAMSAPDNELIAETLLYAEGFKHASILAQKVISVFTLSKQLLTKQIHYDWGLRALKTILTVAGQIIQSERKGGQQLDENQEAEILIKAIRINTMSKLTFIDMNKFVALMQDIFPGVSSKDIVYEQLTKSVEEVLKEKQLDVIETQISKIMQFYEATKQRMGVVLVGPSGCGKTTIWQTLKKAHEKMGQQVKTYIMNPKSMPRSQLLGLMNNDTREFTEGVLTQAARQVVKTSQDVINWILCDGDIDPEWIESLNSVLDDNHLLTLPTGERISFGDNVNFIFETNDLSFASPATVSRMGMIFLNNEDISIKAVVNKWIKKQKEDKQSKFENLLDEYFYKALEYVQQFEEQQVVPTTRVGLVMNVLSQLPEIKTKRQFICNMIRGFASNFNNQLRGQIASHIFQFTGEAPVTDLNSAPLDYFVKDNDQASKFIHSTSKFTIQDFTDAEDPPILHTVGAQRDLDILKPWVDNCEPFVVCGPEGCGKSLIINSAFNELRKKIKLQVATIFCNAQTTAAQIIQKLNQICSKGTFANGRILRPKECSRLVLFLKDINLPKPDKYNTIQLIAFLQQMISHRGYYDESLEFIYLDEKIQVVASMASSTTVGRHDLSSRFTANVRVLTVDYPAKDQLGLIYEEYANTLFQQKFNFDKGISAEVAKKYAKMLCELYKNIKQKFTVDQQRHYMFTPRNLTQILFGMQRYEIDKADPTTLYEASFNEIQKSFKDKLVSTESERKFDTFLNSLFKAIFQFQMSQGVYFMSQVGSKTLLRMHRADLENQVSQGLLAYEREIKEMKLILLDEVLNLLSSLDRALSVPGGVLLAGRPGVGRKSCASLVATMLRIKMVTPSTQRDYGLREFKKELKGFLEIAAVENNPLILYIEDHQLVKPEFLELLNSLISSGEIPGLYTQDEVEHLFQSPEEVRQEYYGKSLYEAFCIRVKKQLRVVFSMDYTQSDFASNCASNPALFTKCTVMWKHSWSKDSMNILAKSELQETLEKVDESVRSELINNFVMIHNSTENSSPQDFFGLLSTFQKIFNSKINSKSSTAGHLKKGLGKLSEAGELVDKLNKDAQIKKVDLAKAQKIADAALGDISKAMADAAERKQETEKIQNFLTQEEGKVVGQKQEVEEELKEVQPLIDEAKKSVSSISKSNLDFLRGLKMPPQPIIDVMKGVIRVFGSTDSSWNGIKKFLSQRSVLDNILDFDPKSITADLRRDIQNVIQQNPNSFEKAVIYKASQAAGPMADWLKAILSYSKVLEKVEPLMKELRALDKKLEGSRKRLRECQGQLEEINQKVEKLKSSFAEKTSEAEKLKQDLLKAEEILEKANTLLGKLSEEQKRWKQQEKEIESELQQYPTFSILASAFTTYLSDGDENMREKYLNDWKGLVRSQDFEYLRYMTTESIMLKWKAEGLPSDSLSLENSVMIFETSRVPLLIDPNTQATEWLKNNLKALGNVDILNQNDQKFTNQLELAVKFGKTLVIQELDNVEAILVPILRKDLTHSGPRWVVQIGDKQIDYNENFNMYLCTRNSNIDIRPNTVALVQVINYSVTKSGLEGKLLSIIINHEQPELEKKKQDLLENEEKLKIQLSDLEKSLLEELASSTGNILENTALLDSLNQTKSKSQVISKSLQESSQLQANLDQQREVYRTLASKGANLFILIQDLKKVNNMYRFSLGYFISLFQKCLLVQQEFSQMSEKLKQCAVTLNKIVFNQIASSLFKADRLTFGLHMVNGMFPELFQKNEWDFLLGNTAVAMDSNSSVPKWANPDCAEQYSTFTKSLPKVAQQINFNDREWEQWAKDLECENTFPETYKSRLSIFEQTLLVQIFRPERLQTSLNQFVCKSLQIKSTSGSQLQFKQIFENESSTTVPVLFVVSSGSDPSTELEEFAAQQIGRENFQQLSMGGNQNELALKMLREAALKGYWVCFKNLHLVTSWLPNLEKEFKMLEPHQNFRLWLTTEAHAKFPAILLETCFKVSYESPPGIKKNLQRTYQGWQNSVNFQGGPQIKSQIYFVLAWFHALMQERRTYIPQGWSKFYEFSYGDLKAGENIIENILEENSNQINWNTLYGLFENAIYGGRIDGFFDNKVLRAYLEHYFSPEVVGGRMALPIGQSVPSSTNLKDYVQIIQKISETDNPSLFGLPMNIDKAVQRFNTSQVISSLKVISRASSEDLKFDKEKWAAQLNPIINLWKQLYKQLSEGGGQPQIKQSQLNSSDPIEAFVYLEASQAYQMLTKIEASINGLNEVLSGNGLLTTEIQITGSQLMLGEVPNKWSSIWDGADLPNVWLKGFAKRVYSLKKWVERTNQKSLLDDELNLSELFHPEVFLNALRQKCCRLLQKPLNEMKFATSFSNFNSKQIVKLKGLLLQGCDISGEQFTDGPNDLPEFIQLPTLYISYIHVDSPELHSKDKMGEFPIFTNSSREKFLVSAGLPNSGSLNSRIIAGVALFLSSE